MQLSHARGRKSGVPWLVSCGVQPAGALEGQGEVGHSEPGGGAAGRLLVSFLEEAMQA